VVPGRDAAHATAAVRYPEERDIRPEFLDKTPVE